MKNRELLELTGKVKVSADDALSAVFPAVQAAVVTIKTRDREYTDRVDFPKGEPENPLTEEEFRSRYNGLMEYAGVEPAVSAAVYDAVRQTNANVEDLINRL